MNNALAAAAGSAITAVAGVAGTWMYKKMNKSQLRENLENQFDKEYNELLDICPDEKDKQRYTELFEYYKKTKTPKDEGEAIKELRNNLTLVKIFKENMEANTQA